MKNLKHMHTHISALSSIIETAFSNCPIQQQLSNREKKLFISDVHQLLH